MDQNDFIKGALLGGVLGSVAALLMAPKAGKDLRDDIVEGYNTINKRSHQFASDVRDQGQSLYDTVNGVENDHTHNTFLVGGAIGAVVGVVAALLLAPKSGDKLREQLGDRYDEIREKAESVVNNFNSTRHNIEDKIDDWKDTFVTIVDKLSSPKKGKHNSTTINDIVDWASLGLRLYNQLQKRR